MKHATLLLALTAGCAHTDFTAAAAEATAMQDVLMDRALQDCGPDLERACMAVHHASPEDLKRLIDLITKLRNAETFKEATIYLEQLYRKMDRMGEALEATE